MREGELVGVTHEGDQSSDLCLSVDELLAKTKRATSFSQPFISFNHTSYLLLASSVTDDAVRLLPAAVDLSHRWCDGRAGVGWGGGGGAHTLTPMPADNEPLLCLHIPQNA